MKQKKEDEKTELNNKLFPIKGYEGIYSVTKNGNFWSHEKIVNAKNKSKAKKIGKWRKFSKDKNGYLLIALYKNKKGKTLRAHRLIAQTFISNPLNKPEINHKNGIRTDNRIENLEWVTHKENIKHAKINGKYQLKCNKKQIEIIKKNHVSKEIMKRKLWEQYNISVSTYYRILRKKNEAK